MLYHSFFSLMNSNYRLSLFSRYNFNLSDAVFLLCVRNIITLILSRIYYFICLCLFVILLGPQTFDRGWKISQWNNYTFCLQTTCCCEKTLLSITLIYFKNLPAQLMQSLGSFLHSTYFVIYSVMYLIMLIHSCLI